jgi:DNA polymerase-3 subunit delta
VPAFKPAYLIHGDDHGRIAERRTRLRELAEAESGVQGLEVFEGDASTPEAVAAALNAMTFALGRRFIVVDGVETWKDKDFDVLEAALAAIAPDTTVAFFAREEGRTKAPQRLHDAVLKAGGTIDAEENVKPWELPKWVIARGRELGLRLDIEAARALVAQVGDRQQRLLRELEKLALGFGPDAQVSAAEIEDHSATSAERKAWSLADTLVAGEAKTAVRMYLALRSQGERVPGLLYWMAGRMRTAHEIAHAVDAGEPVAQIKRGLRMPSRAADRLIADARESGSEKLRHALEEIADLEMESRGGGSGVASEDTVALLSIRRMTS